MGRELILFVKSVWYGSFLFFLYDCLRILRKTVSHTGAAIAVEDLLYWMGAAFFLFSVFFRENSGILRGYLFVGAGVGALAWKCSLSTVWVDGLSRMLIKIHVILKIPTRKLLILAKRLKFWVVRCNISLYRKGKSAQKKCSRRTEPDRGAENEEKTNRSKAKKYKSKTHRHSE